MENVRGYFVFYVVDKCEPDECIKRNFAIVETFGGYMIESTSYDFSYLDFYTTYWLNWFKALRKKCQIVKMFKYKCIRTVKSTHRSINDPKRFVKRYYNGTFLLEEKQFKTEEEIDHIFFGMMDTNEKIENESNDYSINDFEDDSYDDSDDESVRVLYNDYFDIFEDEF
jgi:hypothetical protein